MEHLEAMVEGEERWAESGPVVSVAWLRDCLEEPGVRVIDARPAASYAAAHLPGALNLDLYALQVRRSDAVELERFVANAEVALRRLGVRSGERVIFYEDVAGSIAARGVWLLDYLGHGGGAMLDGGLHAWVAADGPLTQDVPSPAPSDFRAVPDPALLATADEIQAALETDAAPTLLDTWNDAEHTAGAIPGSVHVEWIHHLNPDGTLRSPTTLRRLYAEAGLPPRADHPVVAYCASGFRAAHAYVVLRTLGYENVANYAPSWGEWGRRHDLPVAVAELDAD